MDWAHPEVTMNCPHHGIHYIFTDELDTLRCSMCEEEGLTAKGFFSRCSNDDFACDRCKSCNACGTPDAPPTEEELNKAVSLPIVDKNFVSDLSLFT
jgi:hypothetical protein